MGRLSLFYSEYIQVTSNFKITGMKKFNFGVLICLIFLSCSNSGPTDTKEIYNKKANEIIIRAIKLSECDCLLEIPDQSMIEISKQERPSYDIQSDLIKKLNVRNKIALDSLSSLSNNFKLDYEALKKNNIQIVTRESLLEVRLKNDRRVFKMCPKGIICISKPIFSKDFKKAVLDFSFAFMCTRGPLALIEFKNGKWEDIEE